MLHMKSRNAMDIKLNKADLPDEIQSLEVGDSVEIAATLTVTSQGKGTISASLEDIECTSDPEACDEEDGGEEEEASPSEGTSSHGGKGMGVIVIVGGKHPKK